MTDLEFTLSLCGGISLLALGLRWLLGKAKTKHVQHLPPWLLTTLFMGLTVFSSPLVVLYAVASGLAVGLAVTVLAVPYGLVDAARHVRSEWNAYKPSAVRLAVALWRKREPRRQADQS